MVDITVDGNELYCERENKTDIRVLKRRCGTISFFTVRSDEENIRTMLPIELIEAIAEEFGEHEYEVGIERADGTFKHVTVRANSADQARKRAREEYNDRYGEPEWFVYQTHNLDTGEEITF